MGIMGRNKVEQKYSLQITHRSSFNYLKKLLHIPKDVENCIDPRSGFIDKRENEKE